MMALIDSDGSDLTRQAHRVARTTTLRPEELAAALRYERLRQTPPFSDEELVDAYRAKETGRFLPSSADVIAECLRRRSNT